MESLELLNELKNKTSGLFLMSESDVPFETFYAHTNDINTYLQNNRQNKSNNNISEVKYDDFYHMYVAEKDWHNEIQKNFAKKLGEALELLKTEVSEIKVFRVGSTNIDLYIIGEKKTTEWTGLKSGLVETGD